MAELDNMKDDYEELKENFIQQMDSKEGAL